ncbi:xanthine dehydrogenase [Wohlfahrtiimonas chitiniclastica]|nr:xanthine dehydrogenase [Wohlfahrtiimonas chitiniclastica]
MIVPQLVSGQIQGGTAMGIGHALMEELPLYDDGPGNGTWNFNRYILPRAKDVAVWQQSTDFCRHCQKHHHQKEWRNLA